jgi:hypothetical protein
MRIDQSERQDRNAYDITFTSHRYFSLNAIDGDMILLMQHSDKNALFCGLGTRR